MSIAAATALLMTAAAAVVQTAASATPWMRVSCTALLVRNRPLARRSRPPPRHSSRRRSLRAGRQGCGCAHLERRVPARELPRQHPRHHPTALAVREPDLSAAEGLDDDRQGYPVTVRLRLSSRARVTIRARCGPASACRETARPRRRRRRQRSHADASGHSAALTDPLLGAQGMGGSHNATLAPITVDRLELNAPSARSRPVPRGRRLRVKSIDRSERPARTARMSCAHRGDACGTRWRRSRFHWTQRHQSLGPRKSGSRSAPPSGGPGCTGLLAISLICPSSCGDNGSMPGSSSHAGR